MIKQTARFALAFLCAVWLSCAHAAPVLPIGNVTSAELHGQSVKLRTDNAYAELSLYGPSILRVRLAREPLGRDFSYAVVAAPQAANASLTQDADQIMIRTPAMTARVSKRPFAVRVFDAAGKLLTQDEPGLGTSWIGDEVSTYKTLQEGERFIGLGEKTGNLDRRGSAYTNWNTDAFRYGEGSDPLYATVPFYMGVHHGAVYGIFLDNSHRTDFNFGASNRRFSSFTAHGGEMNYYVFAAPSVPAILRDYSALTGRMPLPPLWSLGYQQNRYSYMSETDVLRIAHTLREKRLPADGITLDIHYMDAYKVFTWDRQRFPDPARLTKQLADLGLKLTVIVDPGIKEEAGYATYESGQRQDVFVKYADGSAYSGEVWPGWCAFPDFTAARGRAWWAGQAASYAKAGVAGLWNDMNEISTWGQTMPGNLIFDFDGRPTTHQEARNVYALNMTRASYEGMKQATGLRPFLLTRSGYAGSQRYSALWTGDNQAYDEHMLLGVRLLNSLGLSGMPFVGMDVGGFMGVPTQGLFARWMQIGAFNPYFRNHSAYNSKASEPWTFGEDVLNVARTYIDLRYRLLPYLYSSFREASASGLPVMRSLAIDYTHAAQVYQPAYQNQYLFGPAFLVLPFESTRDAGKAWFPPGLWYGLYDDAPQPGGVERLIELSVERLPVYVKGGSIVPMQSLVQSTAERPTDTLALHIWRGEEPSSFRYYEDDGASFAHEKGAYFERAISVDPAARRIDFGAAAGSFRSKFSKVEVILHGFGATAFGPAHANRVLGADGNEETQVSSKTVAHDGKAFSIRF